MMRTVRTLAGQWRQRVMATRCMGVAFGANLYSANTGGNDNMTYGPNQDYDFFLQGYSALADAGAK